jgi:deazaflavin-dependent oxidoreductase (nitroreductase family)
MRRYQKPDAMTKRVFNPLVMLATRMGLSMRGSRVLAIRGRKSGAWRTVPVNLLHFRDARYLVAPRGETEWVRNMRAAGGGELRLGGKRETFRAEPVPDDDKPPILRAYLKIWKSETSKFFGGVTDQASDDELRRIAADHPVFRIIEPDGQPVVAGTS